MAYSEEDEPREPALYDCNICLATATNAVICLCGHLFCWPCLHQWMLTPCPLRRCCPACREPLDSTKVIPLYGRNSSVQNVGGQMVPRPSAQRLEPRAEIGSMHLGFQAAPGYANSPIRPLAAALLLSNEKALLLFFGMLCLCWLIAIL